MSTTINDIRSLPDPQRSYKWRVTFSSFNHTPLQESESKPFSTTKAQLDSFVNASTSAGNRLLSGATSNITGVSPRIKDHANTKSKFNPSLLVEEVQGLSLPNIDREAFYEGGRETYFPSLETVTPVTFTFYQDVTGEVIDYIMQWKRKTITENGLKELPKNYKQDIIVELLNGYNEPIYKFTLSGCFPTATSPYTLNNQSENLKLIQEFSIDRITVQGITTTNQGLKKPDLKDRLDSRIAQEVQKRGTIITNTTQKANSLGDFL